MVTDAVADTSVRLVGAGFATRVLKVYVMPAPVLSVPVAGQVIVRVGSS